MTAPAGTPGIEDFLGDFRRNLWLTADKMEVYVRKASHVISGDVPRCFDIASITVGEEHRGKGLFSSWLDYVEATLRGGEYEFIYVENVLNPLLLEFLRRRGYQQTGEMTCMFKAI